MKHNKIALMLGIFLTLPEILCAAKEFDFRKSYWNVWPREAALTCKRLTDGKNQRIEFTQTNLSGKAMLYTYADLEPGKRYHLKLTCSYHSLRMGKSPNAGMRVLFSGPTEKSGSAGSVAFPLAIPVENPSGSQNLNLEFDVPETANRAQIIVLNLENTAGVFTIQSMSLAPVNDTIILRPVSSPPVIDGILNDSCWTASPHLDHFYVYGFDRAAESGTSIKITYDKDTLYMAVRAEEKHPEQMKKNITENGGMVWADDSIEVFLTSPRGKKIQVILNSLSTCWDGELYVRVPGDPYHSDPAWNGKWRGRASVSRDAWCTEFAIPFSDLEDQPRDGDIWRLNVVRNSPAGKSEISQLNYHDELLNNVECFAELEWGKDNVQLRRFRKKIIKDPLAVKRSREEFSAVPRREDGSYSVTGMSGSFLLNSRFYTPVFRKENAAAWPERQKQILNDLVNAGFRTYPVGFPWVVVIAGGRQAVEKIATDRHLKYSIAIHNTSHDRQAIADGARYYIGNSVNAVDPVLHHKTREFLTEYVMKNPWIKPLLIYARGYDEPTNNLAMVFSRRKNPGQKEVLDALDREIRQDFGYNRYGLFDAYADNVDKDAPFRRIAFFKWWNTRFADSLKTDRELVGKLLPGVSYLPEIVNSVTAFSGAEIIPEIGRHADILGTDPYPTATLAAYGRERAIYHTGFSIKLIRDMIPEHCRMLTYLQAFNYHGRSPSRENIREWTSQALKNGADIIDWYADGNLEHCPEIYNEALRVSGIVTRMKPLRLPENTKTALLYSFIDVWGSFAYVQNSHYSLYTILGERINAWFHFVADVSIENNPDILNQYRLLLVPGLTYTTMPLIHAITKYVEQGGTLVFFDPRAMSFLPDGTSPETAGRKLLGAIPGKSVQAEYLVALENFPGVNASDALPLFPCKNIADAGKVAAFRIVPPVDATVFAAYPDGTPAAYSRKTGKGTVYYFAAQPFGNAASAFQAEKWELFLKTLLNEAGEKYPLPIWNFMIPEKHASSQ